MSYWTLRRQVELMKKAQGKPSVDIPIELIQLERQLAQSKAKLEKIKAEKAEEEQIGEAAVAVSNIEAQMRTVIAKLKLQ